jgi:hypothetical protein
MELGIHKLWTWRKFQELYAGRIKLVILFADLFFLLFAGSSSLSGSSGKRGKDTANSAGK